MTAHVNVMLHPMGRGGHHITRAHNGGDFYKANTSHLQAPSQEWAVLGLA
jgi:hypothetical protein